MMRRWLRMCGLLLFGPGVIGCTTVEHESEQEASVGVPSLSEPSPNSLNEREPEPENRPTFPAVQPAQSAPSVSAVPTIWVGGDVMTSAQIRDAAADHADGGAAGIAAMFGPLSQRWRDDFVIVNLETPVTAQRRVAHDSPLPRSETRLARVFLNAPPYFVEGLQAAGVDAVTLANNHAMDQGAAGLEETARLVRGAGLMALGAGSGRHHRWPLRFGQGETSVEIWNFYDGPRGEARQGAVAESWRVSMLDDAAFTALQDSDAAHIVAIVHVVGERQRQPDERWRLWAARLRESGADVVLVHGTHIPMRVERAPYIAWGLGNLLTDMGRQASPRRPTTSKLTDPETRQGLVARIQLLQDEHGTHLDVTLLPVFETDDRFIRWHRGGAEGESTFWIRPLTACSPAVQLPDSWAEPWRGEYARWLTRGMENVVRRTGLTQDSCADGGGWLQ